MKRRASPGDGIEVSTLLQLETGELHNLWRRLHHRPPPKALAGDLLVRILAHDLQVVTFGGLSPATKARLKHAVDDVRQGEEGEESKAGLVRSADVT